MAILIIGIAVISIALGAAGAVWAQDYWRQRKAPRELKPILEWRPTLRMDARATAEAELSEDDNVPANWTLQTEEIRLVESVGIYASDVNVVGHPDALKADGGERGLSSTDKEAEREITLR